MRLDDRVTVQLTASGMEQRQKFLADRKRISPHGEARMSILGGKGSSQVGTAGRKVRLLTVLDVGSSKVSCVIARLRPHESGVLLPVARTAWKCWALAISVRVV